MSLSIRVCNCCVCSLNLPTRFTDKHSAPPPNIPLHYNPLFSPSPPFLLFPFYSSSLHIPSTGPNTVDMVAGMVEDMTNNFCERWTKQGDSGRVKPEELESFFRDFLAEDLNTNAEDGSMEAVAHLFTALYDECKGGMLDHARALQEGRVRDLPEQLRWHFRLIAGTCVNDSKSAKKKGAGGGAKDSGDVDWALLWSSGAQSSGAQ